MSTQPTYDELLDRVKELEGQAQHERDHMMDSNGGKILYKSLFDEMLAEAHIWELVRDANGEILTWRLINANPAALNIWGKTIDEVKGKTADEIFPGGRSTETFMPIIKAIFKEQKPRVWERFFHGTDQILYMVSIPIGEIFISCGIDVADIRRTENDLLKKTAEINEILMAVVYSMSKALESRDPYTAGHQQRVSIIAEKIATELQLESDRIEGIRLSASIHDIGKISIPSAILTKPTPLEPAEREIIKAHVTAGADIISGIKFPWPIRDIILQHHERLDGSGYPKGLTGDQILLESRIVAVADVFESICSHRPYRRALGETAALKELNNNRGTLYDGDVVDALIRLIKTGKLVVWVPTLG